MYIIQDKLKTPPRTGGTYLRRKATEVDLSLLEQMGEIDGISIRQLVETINHRIVHYDTKKNMISQWHFWRLKDSADKSTLDVIFKESIIPSLQEDFYIDLDYKNWEKLYDVLGDGFIKKKICSGKNKIFYRVKNEFDYNQFLKHFKKCFE
ncbi:MAG: hypothetical protein PHV08_05225 [Sulfurovaceae bacterium]|nr:hypothetical protein [Sulfurovaceae bacterium]